MVGRRRVQTASGWQAVAMRCLGLFVARRRVAAHAERPNAVARQSLAQPEPARALLIERLLAAEPRALAWQSHARETPANRAETNLESPNRHFAAYAKPSVLGVWSQP